MPRKKKEHAKEHVVLKRNVTDVPPLGPGDIASWLPELTGESSHEADGEE